MCNLPNEFRGISAHGNNGGLDRGSPDRRELATFMADLPLAPSILSLNQRLRPARAVPGPLARKSYTSASRNDISRRSIARDDLDLYATGHVIQAVHISGTATYVHAVKIGGNRKRRNCNFHFEMLP